MSTFYSEYHYDKELRKAIQVEKSDFWRGDIFRDVIVREIANLETSDGNHSSQALTFLCADAEATMLAGRGVSYFITTPELADMIVASVPDFTADVLDVFSAHRETAFVIHPPSPKPAVLVGLRTVGRTTTAVIRESGGPEAPVRFISPQAFISAARLKPSRYADRLAIGLALYVRYFPSAVQDGLPVDAKHPAHHKNRPCVSVRMADELIERKARAGPEPHPRGFFFRFLGSEKFTHKRGTHVFVGPTWVQGTCKIVVEVTQKKSA